MRERVTISYRGAAYEIGRGKRSYGIWTIGEPRSEPVGRWPDTPEGWAAAWTRFTGIEKPETIGPAGPGKGSAASTSASTAGTDAGAGADIIGMGGDTRALGTGVLGTGALSARALNAGALRASVPAAAALLAVGIICGVAGLFPHYLGGSGLASQPAELVPHVAYLAAWTLSAVLIVLGGARRRAGALLGLGTSIVTLGLFFTDLVTGLTSGGTDQVGIGLIIGLIGWLGCAAGSMLAYRAGPAGAPGAVRGYEVGRVILLVLAGLGAAAAFAPAWDSYLLRNAAGQTASYTFGDAFSAPGWVIFGNVVVMITFAAVVVIAALWRPLQLGAMLLAGAIIPLAAQAVSALVQVGEPTSPTLFGITPSQATASGLTISNGVTPAFWIYCVFVVVLVVSCVWMLISPPAAASDPAASQQSGAYPGYPSGAYSGGPYPGGPYPGGPAPGESQPAGQYETARYAAAPYAGVQHAGGQSAGGQSTGAQSTGAQSTGAVPDPVWQAPAPNWQQEPGWQEPAAAEPAEPASTAGASTPAGEPAASSASDEYWNEDELAESEPAPEED